ncbi:Odorant receptor [Sergentomyia squamirostris]
MEDPEFFFYAKFYFKVHGFSLEVNGNNVLYKFWSIFNIVMQQTMFMSLIYNVYDKYPDVYMMVSYSTVCFGFTVNSFKILTVFKKIEKIGDFYRRMISFWKFPLKSEKSILMEHKSFSNVVSILNFFSLFLGVSWWVLLPPAISAYETYVIGSQNVTWISAFNVTYIKTFNTSPGYQISMAVYYIATEFCVFGGCGFDSFFLESCFFLSGHFKIIQKRFEQIQFDNIKSSIADIVEYQNEVIDACESLQDLLCSAIFPFLFLDSIVICTCLYTLLSTSGIIVTIAFIGITSATVTQIFVLTYSGEVITQRSQGALESIYNSDWYSALPSQRKYLIPCMMEARKGFKFKMVFFELLLTTLSTILQTAGSYFALLKTVSGN